MHIRLLERQNMRRILIANFLISLRSGDGNLKVYAQKFHVVFARGMRYRIGFPRLAIHRSDMLLPVNFLLEATSTLSIAAAYFLRWLDVLGIVLWETLFPLLMRWFSFSFLLVFIISDVIPGSVRVKEFWPTAITRGILFTLLLFPLKTESHIEDEEFQF
uniref:Uncharacterized protein n=1 Tax=Glossina austeni TaxID=7395 RepID=A0A1A9UHL1_GLOAU